MHRTPRDILAAAAVGGLLLVPVACSDDGDDTATSDTSAEASGTSEEATVGDVTIAEPWARPTTPGTTTSAIYMTLTSAEGDVLTGASVPASVAGTTEIHETRMAGGDMDDMSDDTMAGDMDMSADTMADMSGFAETDDEMDDMSDDTMAESGDGMEGMDGEMEMVEVGRIDLPAGETVALEPGGYHIMLLDVEEPLEAGDEIEVTLEFEKAGSTTITVPVGQP